MMVDIKNLKRLRQHSGRSIRQLAKDARISHSHLAYIEAGVREPREKIIKKLADALGVGMEDLLL